MLSSVFGFHNDTGRLNQELETSDGIPPRVSTANCNRNAQNILGFSIVNAEMMENCP